MSSTWPNRVRVRPSELQNCGAVKARALAGAPSRAGDHHRGSCVAAVVDELLPFAVGDRDPADPERRARRRRGRGARCPARYGSLAASTPSTNGPPGTSTEVPARPGRPAGKLPGSRSSAAPVRRFKACSMVSSCWFSWLTTSPKTKAARSPVGSSGSASSASSAAERTVRQYDRACSGDSSGNSTRLARECSKAS